VCDALIREQIVSQLLGEGRILSPYPLQNHRRMFLFLIAVMHEDGLQLWILAGIRPAGCTNRRPPAPPSGRQWHDAYPLFHLIALTRARGNQHLTWLLLLDRANFGEMSDVHADAKIIIARPLAATKKGSPHVAGGLNWRGQYPQPHVGGRPPRGNGGDMDIFLEKHQESILWVS
jgi:hypothetical protein